MVDPVSDEDRGRTLRRVKLASIALVGVSAGLITLHGDGSIEAVLVATVVGLTTGAALVWYLFPDLTEMAPASDRRYRK